MRAIAIPSVCQELETFFHAVLFYMSATVCAQSPVSPMIALRIALISSLRMPLCTQSIASEKKMVIQVGSFGLEILQRVKQNSSSWWHLLHGRVASTKIYLIRTAVMSWLNANKATIETIHTSDTSAKELNWNSEMSDECRSDKDFLKSLYVVLFTDNGASV
eukprot:m.747289 g.747289  ORF g.747289 m.747289 type:complete len:162 (-) comp23143_c1_seq18:1037-1522(-)